MTEKTKTLPYVVCSISLGGYGPQIHVDVKKAGQLFELLAGCQIVESEWTGDRSVKVTKKDCLSMALVTDRPISREEYEALRQAVADEKKAKEEAEAGLSDPVD